MNLALEGAALPVRFRPERRMTDEELLAFCAAHEPARVEREANGELILMSPTFSEGGGIEISVGGELYAWSRVDGRGKCFGSNAGFTLPDSSVRTADAAWMSWDRWNSLTAEQRNSFAPVCPEFVIEVRSASDRLQALREKMESWTANGAELAWLIDPERKLVEVYRPGAVAEVYENPRVVEGAVPVGGFVLMMERVWS